VYNILLLRNLVSQESSFLLHIREVSGFKFRTGYRLTSHSFLQPQQLIARTNSQSRPRRNICNRSPSISGMLCGGRLVIGYRRFGRTYRSQSSGIKPLKIGRGCSLVTDVCVGTEMSVTKYQPMSRENTCRTTVSTTLRMNQTFFYTFTHSLIFCVI